ncbi:MAG: hypothetical protein ACYSTJ_08740 [Planctomycetota bacterium]|jgi:hypothetical protein
MVPVSVILIVLILGWAAAILWLKIHGKAVSVAVSSCPKCGGKTAVTPDPPNSRLAVLCQDDSCGCTSYRSVRASALSLFGVTQLLLAFLAAALGYALGDALGYRPAARAFTALVGLLLGGIVARFFVHLVVLALLQSNLQPAWQEEIVAYLAPPPFLKRK